MDHVRDGYRLAEGVDLFDFTAKLRQVMNPIRDRLDATWLMEHAVGLVDRADVKGEPRPEHPLMDALNAWDAEQDTENARGYRQALVSHRWDPHGFGVQFARDDSDGGTGRILAILYTSRAEFREAWEALPEVEKYCSSAVDVAEAESRGYLPRLEAWQRAVGICQPTVSSTIGFQLRSDAMDNGMLRLVSATEETDDRALLIACAPTLTKRAHDVALGQVIQYILERDNVEPGYRSTQVIVQHLRSDISDVVAVAEQVLDPAAVTYLFNPDLDALSLKLAELPDDANHRTRPIDLTAVKAAARLWADAARDRDEDQEDGED